MEPQDTENSAEAHSANVKKRPEKHEEADKKHTTRVLTTPLIALIFVAIVIILFNQFQIASVAAMVSGTSSGKRLGSGDKALSDIDITELKSTGHTVAAVFPVENIKTQEDAVAIMFPTGTPDYGEELGVSFDDPIGSLDKLSKMYRGLKAEVERNNPEGWNRFMNLASKPVGISCEYCCGVGAVGIQKDGSSACGCQHNPALLTIALYLSAYTDYSDGEILREVMKWKTLFFPKNMIELGMTVAGGDTSALEKLPGMVGGC